jgi:hypothetical protein
MSGFGLPGGPRPSGPWHTQIPAPARPVVGPDYDYGAAPALPAGWGDFTGAQIARPTEAQLQGGHTAMSMPPMGSGMATGATAANPTPGYGPAQSAGAPGGGPFGAANLAYAADPVTWALNYGRAHGHVPGGGRTQMGDFLQQLWGNMAQAIFSLAPDLGTLDPTALMNNILYGGANTMGANAGAFADQALGDLRGKTGSMDESQQLKLLNAYDALKTMGRNSYWQNARENQLQGALEEYKNRNLMQYGAQGQEPPTDLFSFIMGRPGIDIYGR